MAALAISSLLIIVQVAYSCIPLQSSSSSSEVPSEPPIGATTNTTTTAVQKETTTKPMQQECVTVELNPGQPCVFPFTYQYHQHHQCIPFKGKYWCALTPIYTKELWGYCDQALCPPTGPGSTINTTEEATTWEDGTTTLTIQYQETFSCDIYFKFAFKQGVQFKEATSICSGSSSQSNDVILKLGIHRFYLTSEEGIELSCEVGAAFLVDSKSLSEEVLASSLMCEAVEADCITVEGEVFPAHCVIPFNHKGRRYLGCTDRPGSNKFWCPTKTDEKGEAEDWGFCSKKCGYCGGSPITTRGDQEESCGYDCLIGADWDMVGYDKAPLKKPTIAVSLPTKSNYIEEKGEQHLLNIGPQSITISCLETKFYDPALQQESEVTVECGPEKYRLTVRTKCGASLGQNFKNDQFGCDPCSKSMSYIEGLLSSSGVKSLGIHSNIGSIGQCNDLCSDNTGCNSFEFSKYEKRCHLVQDILKSDPSATKFESITICSKSSKEEPSTLKTRGFPTTYPGTNKGCPPEWKCIDDKYFKKTAENGGCDWGTRLRKNAKTHSKYKTYWDKVVDEASSHTCVPDPGFQSILGACCPINVKEDCVYIQQTNAFPPLSILAKFQCGVKVQGQNEIPGICKDTFTCDFHDTCFNNDHCTDVKKSKCCEITNKCIKCSPTTDEYKQKDCDHFTKEKHCFKGAAAAEPICAECAGISDCIAAWTCVNGKCGEEITCKGYYYKGSGGIFEEGHGFIVLFSYIDPTTGNKENREAHFHLGANREKLEIMTFPWPQNKPIKRSDGQDAIAKIDKWLPVLKVCQQAVKESTYTWTTGSFFKDNPKDSGQQNTVKAAYPGQLPLP